MTIDLGPVLSAATDYGDAREAEGRAAAEVEAAERIAELNAALILTRAERDEAQSAIGGLVDAYEEQQAKLAALRAEYEAHMATHVPAPKIGASFKAGENLPAPVQTIDVQRFFFASDKMKAAQTWDGQEKLTKAHDQYGCRTYSISFKPDKGAPDDRPFSVVANIERFLDTIPDDVDPANVLLTFYHEHDGNIRDGSLTIARYREGSAQVAAIAHERGHLYGPIHNAMVYDDTKTPKWGLHTNIWAANEADVALYDFWGVDCYSPNYEVPSPRMNPIKTYADSLGLPVLVGELGSPNGTQQANWCGLARTWALANTRWACYWSSQITGETNFRLTDAAARAWFGLPQ